MTGSPPANPELLDYLAVTFQEHNWDLKWLTREIMISHVYRQRSAEVPECLAADPSNKLLWRKAPVRLEAETIRDSMLKISGLMNERMFGPQVASSADRTGNGWKMKRARDSIAAACIWRKRVPGRSRSCMCLTVRT